MSSDAIGAVVEAQRASVQSQIQYSVLAQQLQAVRQSGQAAVELLQAAAELSRDPANGTSFDGQA
jgi:hypothetical protein